MSDMTDQRALWGLPDPDMQAEFYADVPAKRLIAWLLDTLVIALITAIIVPFTAFTALFFLPLLFLVVGFIYRVVSLANRSATPGMRMAAIEFRTHRGERFDLSMAVLHTLGYSLSMSFVFPQMISIILMLTSARRQGLSDMVLGTAAVNRNAGG
ncbi:RDD family protein [Aliiroseovarius subalbicans]